MVAGAWPAVARTRTVGSRPTMHAVGYRTPLPIDAADALVDIELPRPAPTGRDLLVEIRAVSVNPVDTKVRRMAAPEPGGWKVLGFDAAGVVV